MQTEFTCRKFNFLESFYFSFLAKYVSRKGFKLYPENFLKFDNLKVLN